MNAIALNSGFARQRTRGLPSVLQPIDEWSRLRTAFVALGLSVLVAVLGMRAWRMSDASRLDASRVAWSAAQANVEEAGRISAQLPGLKARAASDRLSPEHWSSADALRAVADLAAQSGLRDAAIEPAARKGGDTKTPQPLPERVFRLRAEGSFAEIRRFLEALAGLPRCREATLVGTAGTITSLAAMAQELPVYVPARIQNYRLRLEVIRLLEQDLLSRSKRDRTGLPGLESGREEVIAAGAIMVRTIMETIGEDECLVSEWGLREGVLIDLANKQDGRSPHRAQ